MSDKTQTDDSRRSFMKKGALAAGALAIGAGASANSVAAQEDGNALVFSYDYHPGQSFDVVAQLEQSTTVNVLQIDEEPVSEISQPDEYTGHIIRYSLDGSAGITAFLFSQDMSLSSGDSGTLGEDASMFSPELNLLSTDIGGGGGGGGGGGEGGEDDEEDDEDDTENGGGGNGGGNGGGGNGGGNGGGGNGGGGNGGNGGGN